MPRSVYVQQAPKLNRKGQETVTGDSGRRPTSTGPSQWGIRFAVAQPNQKSQTLLLADKWPLIGVWVADACATANAYFHLRHARSSGVRGADARDNRRQEPDATLSMRGSMRTTQTGKINTVRGEESQSV